MRARTSVNAKRVLRIMQINKLETSKNLAVLAGL
jgi:hypothetical protein